MPAIPSAAGLIWSEGSGTRERGRLYMSDRTKHIPGLPNSPSPPPELAKIAKSLTDPDVTRVGLTTTSDGRWALMVRVKPGAEAPIKKVEEASSGYPVIYQDEPDEPPAARPAYPAEGE
jgi:hypothetical protein